MQIETGQNESKKAERVRQANVNHTIWLGTYIILGLICLGIYFVVRLRVLGIVTRYHTLIQKSFLAGFFIFLVLTTSRYAQALISKYKHVKAIAYNLIQLVRIIAGIGIGMIIIAFLFQNWYTAAVSLGLISLVLGFALQTPISSFIGWLYIIARNPYKVGDRIQINDFKGDVVEIGYLDTTLWEFSGDYLTNDLPSGRLIRFPNTLVFQYEVYNYSWRKFPYIWNEIPFHIAYESDFAFVEEVLRRITKDVLGPDLEEKVKELKVLVKQTAIDELTIREYPFITLRINANTWVEASVNYLVDPKKASSVRTEIIRRAVPELLRQTDKVMFPKSNNR
ncbi:MULTISPECIES: mechanosensitive ion channel family protein [Niastella]|uniref:Mechanosensitive ion channel n=1 Tax=Niastella soli TaxID=2821487 RepID=A0ABS3Z185_9BACT|nr:mechanosensitive ion channel domain-containing protein [Niastella soli]MBO9203925.1 mechanosensitive ion channel [Niastella soli]